MSSRVSLFNENLKEDWTQSDIHNDKRTDIVLASVDSGVPRNPASVTILRKVDTSSSLNSC